MLSNHDGENGFYETQLYKKNQFDNSSIDSTYIQSMKKIHKL